MKAPPEPRSGGHNSHLITARQRRAGRRWWATATGGAALALLLSACGGTGGASSPSPPPPTVTSPASPETTTPPGSDLARLRISQRQTSCCYTEGQVSFLIVRDEDGKKVAKRAFSIHDPNKPVIDLRVPPGRYVVTSYQRPCDATCGYLDPPTDRCTTQITIGSGDDIDVTMKFAPGMGCQLV
jgi:hypothetical protein